MTATKKVAVVGLIAVIAAVLVPLSSDPAKESEEAKRYRDYELRLEAEMVCQEDIQSRLKAPKTADFDTDAMPDRANHARIVVLGTVTAQNSFGALLTQKVGCVWDTVTKALVAPAIINDR